MRGNHTWVSDCIYNMYGKLVFFYMFLYILVIKCLGDVVLNVLPKCQKFIIFAISYEDDFLYN